ncbi:DJ-1/PfpI family protein [Streptomyces sp. NBC_01340]|uniref:GlxA family transcriptional regulator n=1 Tax=unclassified Streptomyces TaxID=2593676 RepID=UPI002255936C|nr:MULTISPECIES: DJ-1/PfpI family protein [unclassified Streptomyces]MCX4459833.1 DJ-1/PfpI family protein [Streptomyces sp. NBC_01719]MCX4499191.1 DJ-1/PfpI family protein [Streptomyces sp. NBC_01728]MCX4594892.1 DJ-1/PfpI family protein [Streptomyces sp. NBC_01549]WSI43603.1 DJ-1/PfpI family protein [Streptomyces sp. NBC_01340]
MSAHRVAVLALPHVLPLDLGIPTQIFNPRPNTPYELTVCGATRGSVTTSTGFTVGATAGLAALARADTIIVPGYWRYRRPPAPEVTAALKLAFSRGARIASICTGAFALAAAGLLNGRTVTTHWASADELEELYPHLRVDRNVLYIDDDALLTSAGVTAGIDLCLHIVRKDLGAAVANDIARELVAAPHRDGGQAQYITQSLPEPTAHTLADTRDWALRHLEEALTLAALADRARVSTRTLVRMWRQETGVTPHQWLLTARVNHARELLEVTDLGIEQIAAQSGLGTSTNLRARFRDALGITPTAYRRTFQRTTTA